MEDGPVSIFGLVFGVAVSAPDSHAVLLAGATGAVAAAVSMTGTLLDVESTNDQAAARPAQEKARLDANSGRPAAAKSPGPVGVDVLYLSVRGGGPGHPLRLALVTARIASLLGDARAAGLAGHRPGKGGAPVSEAGSRQ